MAERSRFRLSVQGPDMAEAFPLPIGGTNIGRRAGNDLVLSHEFVSGQHARIECTGDACRVVDLDSTNGTMLSDQQLKANIAVPLAPGATIRIGPFSLTLEEVVVEPAPTIMERPEAPLAKPRPESEPTLEDEAPPAVEEAEPAPAPTPEKPPPTPPPAPPSPDSLFPPDPSQPPPGLLRYSERLLEYLPGIYQTGPESFAARFLGIFEAILTPIEWTVDNFDLFLSPRTAPADFLPWLANWYEIAFDGTWSERQRRMLLTEAPALYARRGTRRALSRALEIYLGVAPDILEFEKEEEPFTFTVRIPLPQGQVNQALLERMIDANKPAHTTYRLLFSQR